LGEEHGGCRRHEERDFGDSGGRIAGGTWKIKTSGHILRFGSAFGASQVLSEGVIFLQVWGQEKEI